MCIWWTLAYLHLEFLFLCTCSGPRVEHIPWYWGVTKKIFHKLLLAKTFWPQESRTECFEQWDKYASCNFKTKRFYLPSVVYIHHTLLSHFIHFPLYRFPLHPCHLYMFTSHFTPIWTYRLALYNLHAVAPHYFWNWCWDVCCWFGLAYHQIFFGKWWWVYVCFWMFGEWWTNTVYVFGCSESDDELFLLISLELAKYHNSFYLFIQGHVLDNIAQ